MKENLISGLVSGLVVTFIVLLLRNIWTSIIVPWFEERVYKDVRIEGKWFGIYPNTNDLKQDVINLSRHGHSISGKMICTNGGDEGEEYIVSGSFRNMLLPLSYESTDNTKSDRGSITLMCVRNGERLAGKVAYYDTLKDRVDTGTILWFRSKDDLEQIVKKMKIHKEQMKELAKDRERILKEEAEIEDINIESVVEGELVKNGEESANKKLNPTA